MPELSVRTKDANLETRIVHWNLFSARNYRLAIGFVTDRAGEFAHLTCQRSYRVSSPIEEMIIDSRLL